MTASGSSPRWIAEEADEYCDSWMFSPSFTHFFHTVWADTVCGTLSFVVLEICCRQTVCMSDICHRAKLHSLYCEILQLPKLDSALRKSNLFRQHNVSKSNISVHEDVRLFALVIAELNRSICLHCGLFWNCIIRINQMKSKNETRKATCDDKHYLKDITEQLCIQTFTGMWCKQILQRWPHQKPSVLKWGCCYFTQRGVPAEPLRLTDILIKVKVMPLDFLLRCLMFHITPLSHVRAGIFMRAACVKRKRWSEVEVIMHFFLKKRKR